MYFADYQGQVEGKKTFKGWVQYKMSNLAFFLVNIQINNKGFITAYKIIDLQKSEKIL